MGKSSGKHFLQKKIGPTNVNQGMKFSYIFSRKIKGMFLSNTINGHLHQLVVHRAASPEQFQRRVGVEVARHQLQDVGALGSIL
jgi:hypothetical protein